MLLTPLFDVQPEEWLAVKRDDDRCVVVLRDPRDAIVSWVFSAAYSHVTNPATAMLRSAMLSLDLRGKLEVGTLPFLSRASVHVAWAELAPADGALLCAFEDLVTDELRTFRSILEHFGWEVDDDVLRGVVGEYTFARRSGGRERGDKNEFSHQRNGVPGDWRNYFDRDFAERFEKASPGLMRLLGYEQDDQWWRRQPEVVPELGSHRAADDLAGILAARDKRTDDLQREADARLIALEETTAALRRLEEEAAQLRSAAQERLELLHANDRAYAEFKSLIKQRLVDISNSIG
ncbi:MAG TPA: sulfotransferase domain-containing protein [Candidatus Elarobacter sp.]